MYGTQAVSPIMCMGCNIMAGRTVQLSACNHESKSYKGAKCTTYLDATMLAATKMKNKGQKFIQGLAEYK